MRIRLIRVSLIGLCCGFGLAGCGQKGPLFLPQPKALIAPATTTARPAIAASTATAASSALPAAAASVMLPMPATAGARDP